MIRVFLIGDLLSILKGLHMQIALESDLVVVGETRNNRAAPHLIEELKPDVVVIDIDMFDLGAQTSTQEMLGKGFATPIVALGFDANPAAFEKVYLGGVIQYVKKQAGVTELFAAIHQAARSSK